MVFIYIIELENNKYYIGKTSNPDFRINQHFNGDGSMWTRKYKPIRLYSLIPNCDPLKCNRVKNYPISL